MVVMSPYPGDEEFEKDQREAVWFISDAEIDEISVVDRGDNPGAEIVFWKSAGGRPSEPSLGEPGPSDAEIDGICKAAVDYVTREEISKMDTRTSATREMEAMAERIQAEDPSLTPAEAFAKAMKSSHGRDIRKRYEELP